MFTALAALLGSVASSIGSALGFGASAAGTAAGTAAGAAGTAAGAAGTAAGAAGTAAGTLLAGSILGKLGAAAEPAVEAAAGSGAAETAANAANAAAETASSGSGFWNNFSSGFAKEGKILAKDAAGNTDWGDTLSRFAGRYARYRVDRKLNRMGFPGQVISSEFLGDDKANG